MTEIDKDECLRLLTAADTILLASDQHLVAAHLSLAIELLRERVTVDA